MNCPRCKTPIGPLTNPDSIVTCPGCGSRLMTRSAALRSQGAPKQPGEASPAAPPALPSVPVPAPEPPAPAPEPPKPVRAASLPPSATLPPTPAAAPGLGKDTARTKGKTDDDDEARPAGRKRKGDEATLEMVLSEVRAIRETQQLVLDALDALRRSRPVAAAAPGGEDEEGPSISPIRARRQKTVVLVDDDPQTREAAVAELLRANVPVRAFDEGHAALGGIAAEKPDVIALELGLGGDMGGKDLVNMIKATMEWVDIPIILWTREGVANQKEARQIHGADEVVQKSAGPAALVARVITAFRRG